MDFTSAADQKADKYETSSMRRLKRKTPVLPRAAHLTQKEV
jgi:hypothetical protein